MTSHDPSAGTRRRLVLIAALAGTFLAALDATIVATAMLIAVQNSVDRSQRGVVTAMATFSRTIGGAIGIAAMGTMLTTGMASRLSNLDSELRDTNALLDVKIRDTLAPAPTTSCASRSTRPCRISTLRP